MKIVKLFLLLICFSTSIFANQTLINYGATWKYLDNGSNQGTAWYGVTFNDGTWISGASELGYGDGDETTVINGGCTPIATCSPKFITSYFRKSISIADKSIYTNFQFNIMRDDGVVIYVNGIEVFRNNMPTGAISYTTLATAAATDDGNTAQTITIDGTNFVNGNNIIAVEMHQSANNSSDLTFDLELIGIGGENLVSFGSVWKYNDLGVNLGTTWSATGFNDASWLSGVAQLGYGDGDEATLVGAGCTPVATCSPKFITTYFRKSINIADVSIFSSFNLKLKRDDGAIVYVNGTEVYRTNLALGTISFNTLASNATDDGNTNQIFNLGLGYFVTGTNIIAVEIHQTTLASSDISFDLEVNGLNTAPDPLISRGPYLQLATPTSLIVRWRTDIASSSKVNFGTSLGGLTNSVMDNTLVTEHIIQLTGLTPNTKYFYDIGTNSSVLQGDANNFFISPVANGTQKKTSIWVTGDCGNNSTNQRNVRDQYAAFKGTNYTDLWLLLGDNAYNSGLETEYQTNFFDQYKNDMLKKTVLWPCPGNHDYANNATRQDDHNIPYYNIFSLPTSAEAGGIPSGTEAFYSFDYGNIHFLALDSYGRESNTFRLYDTLGPQVIWLKNDLLANTKKWVIAFWHHPPYTMGSHNSDSEGELISIRQNFIQILERLGVDLILNGHSHSYERSYLLNGHYGLENTFNLASHAISNSSAKYDGSINSCPYIKNGIAPKGTVYVLSGSAGQLGGAQGSFPHSAMYYSNTTQGGSLYLEVDDNRLDAKWVGADGVIRDQFTMEKESGKVFNIINPPGNPTTITASFIGNYLWTPNGETTRTINISPSSPTTFSVSDNFNCITDVFNIQTDVLPLELIRFEGEKVFSRIKLNWQTASEVNVSKIVLEKSVDAIHFFEIFQTPTKGTTNGSNYETFDFFPLMGKNYFRLKIIDKDGTYNYSKIISVDFNNNQAEEILVFPNPSKNIFYIQTRNFEEEEINLSVFNLEGRSVYTIENTKIPLNNYLAMDLSKLESGLYMLKFECKSQVFIQKIIKD
jgi:hypothetical protein